MVRAVAERASDLEVARKQLRKEERANERKKPKRTVPRISQKRRSLAIAYPKVQVYVLMGAPSGEDPPPPAKISPQRFYSCPFWV